MNSPPLLTNSHPHPSICSKKIEEELRKAKMNATSNKRAATAALRQKKLYEQELDRLAGRRMTLETQVSASCIATFPDIAYLVLTEVLINLPFPLFR